MNLAQKNVFSATFWLLFSIYVVFESYHMGLGTWRMPGPGFLPFGASILLVIISFSVLLRTLLTDSLKEAPSEPDGDGEPLNYRNLVLALMGLLAYTFMIQPLGFVVSTFLQMVFFVWMIGRRSLLASIIAGLCITVASYLLFQVALDAQFPMGVLESIL